MEVILCQDISSLGKTGDVVKVKEGYARNFLFPRKLVYAATPGNLKKIEQERAKKVAANLESKKQAEEFAEKLSKLSCTVTVEVNDLDKLYGSVSEQDIAKAIEDEGFKVDRKTIVLEKPLDELGIFEVGIKLHPEVMAKVRVWVTKK